MRQAVEAKAIRLFAVLAVIAGLGTVFPPCPARAAQQAAAQQVYEYRIEHPKYGDIGTYTNVITRNGDTTEVKTSLRVAVRFLGIVVYRQEAERSEHWQGGRFVGFDGVTTTNGDKIAVHGATERDHFVITSPQGIVAAPPDIHPSNPWSLQVLMNTNVMMSTKTGKVYDVRVSGRTEDNVKFDGVPRQLFRYDIFTDKQQAVWVNERGVVIAFRAMENGTPVNFVLHESTTAALQPR
jgi:Family of unknown function (DUF6134)